MKEETIAFMVGDHIDTEYTSLCGYVHCDYRDLVRVFGPPLEENWDFKSTHHWLIKIVPHGPVMHIYNWLNGPVIGTPITSITRWNVGGKEEAPLEYLEKILDFYDTDAQVIPYSIGKLDTSDKYFKLELSEKDQRIQKAISAMLRD